MKKAIGSATKSTDFNVQFENTNPCKDQVYDILQINSHHRGEVKKY